MNIYLLDNSLQVKIYFDKQDCNFKDNVCIKLTEDCPEDERLFRAEETNVFLTPKQARQLALALLNAAEESNLSAEKY